MGEPDELVRRFRLCDDAVAAAEEAEEDEEGWPGRVVCGPLGEDCWALLEAALFDTAQLRERLGAMEPPERERFFHFGIGCFLCFVQANFTGPEICRDSDQALSDFLGRAELQHERFAASLSMNQEEINANTRHPVLLVVAKLVFDHCTVDPVVNAWWGCRALTVHQDILEELSPALLANADALVRLVTHFPSNDRIRAQFYTELAQLYQRFRHVTKSEKYITLANEALGLQCELVGRLGKRTRFQERELAQLTLQITLASDGGNSATKQAEEEGKEKSQQQQPQQQQQQEKQNQQKQSSKANKKNSSSTTTAAAAAMPKDLSLNDDIRLDRIEFNSETAPDSGPDSGGGNGLARTTRLPHAEQKLLLTIVQWTLINRPWDGLQYEELAPFLQAVLSQSDSDTRYAVRVMALLLRSRLEGENKRTIERAFRQCEDIVGFFRKRASPAAARRVPDVFGTGLPPIWKVEAQYGNTLLNFGLVKDALEVFLRIRLWEEVIVCHTVLKRRDKAAEVIRAQLEVRPTVKLLCLLGDATDDVKCYEQAWALSKNRSHRAQRHWGQYLVEHKRYEECIPHFEKSLSINPLQASIWLHLGYAALQIEQWQTAATAYRRYTSLEPHSFKAWNNLAQAYIKLGNKRSAHHALLEAIRSNFDSWKLWENLLVVSCDISHFSDVIRAYHRLLDLKGKYLNVEVLSVAVYSIFSDVNDAEGDTAGRFLPKMAELVGRVSALYPNCGEVWELYAKLAGNVAQRIERLQRAYRGYNMQTGWEKDPKSCRKVLEVCNHLADAVLDDAVQPSNPVINAAKQKIVAAAKAARQQDHEQTKPLLLELSVKSEKVLEKLLLQQQLHQAALGSMVTSSH